MVDDEIYGKAWLDHGKWLVEQGNARRAGPERDQLYKQAAEAAETGLVALGYVLPARLLPFDTSLDLALSPSDAEPGPWERYGWWVCRYCGRGEGARTGVRVNLSVAAEQGRCATHEAMCLSRPADQPVSDAERRTMGSYLRSWMQPRLDICDEQIAMLAPRPGYGPDRARDEERARWQTIRGEYLALLTRCGVDDAAMANLGDWPKQTREQFLAEIAALMGRAR